MSAVDAAGAALGRDVRRFNLPVKLALAAAHAAVKAARDRTQVALVSLSLAIPALRSFGGRRGSSNGPCTRPVARARCAVNPTYTLHAIDNSALSSLAIALENRAPYLGLGGAPGQSWCALEFVLERAADGGPPETLILAGDQDEGGQTGAGVAVLLCSEPRQLGATGRTVRLLAVERGRHTDEPRRAPQPHAARGLLRWLAALADCPQRSLRLRRRARGQ